MSVITHTHTSILDGSHQTSVHLAFFVMVRLTQKQKSQLLEKFNVRKKEKHKKCLDETLVTGTCKIAKRIY
jgi:hypothetical protein